MDPAGLTIHHYENATAPPPPMAASNGSAATGHHHTLMHTAFYWGKRALFLFPCWPGKSSGMYAVALVFVFFLAVLVEFFTHRNLAKPGSHRAAKGFFQTGVYGVRVGLAYMLMLAIMSYNVGVFLAAVMGHAFGFGLFSQVFKK